MFPHTLIYLWRAAKIDFSRFVYKIQTHVQKYQMPYLNKIFCELFTWSPFILKHIIIGLSVNVSCHYNSRVAHSNF